MPRGARRHVQDVQQAPSPPPSCHAPSETARLAARRPAHRVDARRHHQRSLPELKQQPFFSSNESRGLLMHCVGGLVIPPRPVWDSHSRDTECALKRRPTVPSFQLSKSNERDSSHQRYPICSEGANIRGSQGVLFAYLPALGSCTPCPALTFASQRARSAAFAAARYLRRRVVTSEVRPLLHAAFDWFSLSSSSML